MPRLPALRSGCSRSAGSYRQKVPLGRHGSSRRREGTSSSLQIESAVLTSARVLSCTTAQRQHGKALLFLPEFNGVGRESGTGRKDKIPV